MKLLLKNSLANKQVQGILFYKYDRHYYKKLDLFFYYDNQLVNQDGLQWLDVAHSQQETKKIMTIRKDDGFPLNSLLKDALLSTGYGFLTDIAIVLS